MTARTTSESFSAAGFQSRVREIATRERHTFERERIPEDFRRAAVLIPFWIEDDEIRVVLTRRSEALRHHKGHVAFAGGSLEEGETWVDAAIREAQEEIGLDPDLVEVIGSMDDAWSGARFHLVPTVAWLHAPPEFRACEYEVAEILIAPVADLLLPDARREETFERGGRTWSNEVVEWSGGKIFGLTADLLLEVLDWGSGGEPRRGPDRESDLGDWLDSESTST